MSAENLLFMALASSLSWLSPSPASEASGVPPLVLEWSEYASNPTWISSMAPSEGFIKLRMRGDASVFPGTWVELSGRVWFGPGFFKRTSTATPPGLTIFRREGSPYDDLRGAVVPWSIESAGYDVPVGVDVPDCILSPELFDRLLDRNGVNSSNPDQVREQSEPMLAMPSGDPETIRVWDLDYLHWNGDAQDYWKEVNGHADYPELVSVDALVKRLILDQSPELTPDFFTSEAWELALNSGVFYELQGITMVGSDNNPGQYAQDDSDPPGLIGGWTATGTTTQLPFAFFGYSGQGMPYPVAISSPVGHNDVVAGLDARVQMSGLRINTYARFEVDLSGNTISLPLRAGATVQEAKFTVPHTLLVGQRLDLRGFEGPEGWSPLAPGHSALFVVVQG